MYLIFYIKHIKKKILYPIKKGINASQHNVNNWVYLYLGNIALTITKDEPTIIILKNNIKLCKKK